MLICNLNNLAAAAYKVTSSLIFSSLSLVWPDDVVFGQQMRSPWMVERQAGFNSYNKTTATAASFVIIITDGNVTSYTTSDADGGEVII